MFSFERKHHGSSPFGSGHPLALPHEHPLTCLAYPSSRRPSERKHHEIVTLRLVHTFFLDSSSFSFILRTSIYRLGGQGCLDDGRPLVDQMSSPFHRCLTCHGLFDGLVNEISIDVESDRRNDPWNRTKEERKGAQGLTVRP